MRKLTVLLTSLFLLLFSMTNSEADNHYQKATFAGGCFWCMQPPFDKLEGVIKTTVGYTGGDNPDPTYQEVSYGMTGHAEAIEIIYDPEKVSYDIIIDIFWMNIDPTDSDGQFADQGSQYRPEIYYHTNEQKEIAEKTKEALEKSGRFDKPIVVNITSASKFYPAEDYHQKYYQKNTLHYNAYKIGSGRAGFLKKKWPQKHK